MSRILRLVIAVLAITLVIVLGFLYHNIVYSWLAQNSDVIQSIEALVAIVAIIVGFSIYFYRTFVLREIEVTEYSKEMYYKVWNQYEIEEVVKVDPNYMYRGQMIVQAGGVSELLTIIEIIFKNNGDRPRIIGRFLFDTWIFGEGNSSHQYNAYGDYRVYDIFTRTPINLQNLNILQPGESWGFRLEIVDKAAGPVLPSPKHVGAIDLDRKKKYLMTFQVDSRTFAQSLDINEPKQVGSLREAHKWAEDIAGQNTAITPWQFPILPQRTVYRLDDNWLARIRNKIIGFYYKFRWPVR